MFPLYFHFFLSFSVPHCIFRLMLGVQHTHPPPGFMLQSPGSAGLADWELDRLLWSRSVENIATASTTITSLAQLLDQIGNIVINDNIAQQVGIRTDLYIVWHKHWRLNEFWSCYVLHRSPMQWPHYSLLSPSWRLGTWRLHSSTAGKPFWLQRGPFSTHHFCIFSIFQMIRSSPSTFLFSYPCVYLLYSRCWKLWKKLSGCEQKSKPKMTEKRVHAHRQLHLQEWCGFRNSLKDSMCTFYIYYVGV